MGEHFNDILNYYTKIINFLIFFCRVRRILSRLKNYKNVLVHSHIRWYLVIAMKTF